MGQAAVSPVGDAVAEPDAVHEAPAAAAAGATAVSTAGGGVCQPVQPFLRGSAGTEPEAPEKDDMLERARARVGFHGLPAAFLLDHSTPGVAAVGKLRTAGVSNSGLQSAGTASGVAGLSAAHAFVPGAAASGSGSGDGQGDADGGGDSSLADEVDGVREEAAGEQLGEPAAGRKSSRCVASGGRSTSYSTSQVESDDLNNSFRHAMLQCVAGGDTNGHVKSAGSLRDSRGTVGGTVGADGACKRGDVVAAEDRGEIGAVESGYVVSCGRVPAPPGGTAGAAGADAGGAACGLPPRPGSHGPACAEVKGAGTVGAAPAAGMRWGDVVGAGQRGESREEGRVLHTFVAESQESLKSLRTLLNRSREGLRAGPQEAALPQHTRLSDHGDAHTEASVWHAAGHTQHSGAIVAPVVSVPGHAVPRFTEFGGEFGVWDSVGRVHEGVEGAVPAAGRSGGGAMCEDLAVGGGMSEASSPARSLVALPAREVHTARSNMLILQCQGSDGGARDLLSAHCHGRSGVLRPPEIPTGVLYLRRRDGWACLSR